MNTSVLKDGERLYATILGEFEDGRVMAKSGYNPTLWIVGAATHVTHDLYTETTVTPQRVFNDELELLSWLANTEAREN